MMLNFPNENFNFKFHIQLLNYNPLKQLIKHMSEKQKGNCLFRKPCVVFPKSSSLSLPLPLLH